MDEDKLTICTVSFHSKEYIDLNWRLTKFLNPNTSFFWHIVENSPPGANNYMEAYPPELLVFQGYEFNPTKKRPMSYHHGTGLNKTIKLAKTRYILLLDPDFYILRKNWIKELLNYMHDKNLTFFGAPYHPKWFTKYRYFPGACCMLIDLEKAKKGTLDFRPGQDDYHLNQNSSILTKIVKRIGNRILTDLYNRRIIGTAQDTGYDVYHRYHQKRKFKNEYIIPVSTRKIDPSKGIHDYFNYILPDRFSFIPKRSDYYSPYGFQEHGYINTQEYGCEEFLWKNKPFGFHLRKQKLNYFDEDKIIMNLKQIISNLTGFAITNKLNRKKESN